jgi:hypothetical protein
MRPSRMDSIVAWHRQPADGLPSSSFRPRRTHIPPPARPAALWGRKGPHVGGDPVRLVI